ncbi:MAG: transporter substrate-binding domain-containing protein [Mycobacterium sp.]
MGARLRAVFVVTLLLAIIGALPGLASPAGAEQRVVTMAVHDLAPFVMTNGNVKTGFTVDILDQVAKHTGWTIKYIDAPDVREQLKAVTENRADAAAGAISITADRAMTFDFSQPMLNGGLQIMVPSGMTERTQPGLMDFLKLLFSKTMLVWLGVALLLTVIPAHITWLIERRHHNSMVSKSYFPGIFEAFGWGLGVLAAQPDDNPRHWGNRGLALVWAFVSIIFVAYYTATLTANLTVERFDAQISSPADLYDKRVCTVAGTTSADFLNELGIKPQGVTTIEECFAGIRTHDYDATVFDAPVLQYYVSHDGAGAAELVGTVFQSEDYGIAFRNGSDLRKTFDEALLSIREDGDYDLIKGKWFGTE